MATNPTMTEHSANLLNALNYYHRNGQYPLDDTSLWNTIEEFETYLNEAGSYRYPGQLVSITNGNAYDSTNTKDVTLAVVRPNGTYQIVGAETIFDSISAAEAYVQANPNTATPGKTITVKYGSTYALYVIRLDKTLDRVSFDTTDIPDVTWENLQGTPTSTVSDIDAAVSKSKNFSEADGSLTYKSNPLAYKSEIPLNYEAAKITGVISIDNLPAGALERLKHVANKTARFALTTANVQLGDTVMQDDTGHMYIVVDDTKLNSEGGYQVYTAGAASSVPWSGVTGKPTTVAASGLTDAVADSDTSVTPTAGKIAVYNVAGKLEATSANADKLGNQSPAYYATAASVTSVDGAYKAADTALSGRITTNANAITDLDGRVDDAETSISTAKTDIANLKSGAAITALAATKLTGIVGRVNLPVDVSGKLIKVVSVTAMIALTTANVNVGDLVQVTGGALYICNNAGSIGTIEAYEKLVDITGSDISWDQINHTPTTLSGYGITDAINTSDVNTGAVASKIVRRDSSGKIAGTVANAETLGGNNPSYYATAQNLASEISTVNSTINGVKTDVTNLKSGDAITAISASKITGTISLDNLPAGALERLKHVSSQSARFALTVNDVQLGDTVMQDDTGHMYIVVDDTKLGTEAGYQIYTAGMASAVPWSGITDKPTTVAGYGITDGVTKSALSAKFTTTASSANAGKAIVLNADGKLDVSITGNVAWGNITSKPASSVIDIDAAVAAATHVNRAVLDALSVSGNKLAYNGSTLATTSDLNTLSINTLRQDESEPTGVSIGQLWLAPITST